MKTLPCGCIKGYDLCPKAKKIYISPLDNTNKRKRRAAWEKLHKHWDEQIGESQEEKKT